MTISGFEPSIVIISFETKSFIFTVCALVKISDALTTYPCHCGTHNDNIFLCLYVAKLVSRPTENI